jgi:hypothetical protein
MSRAVARTRRRSNTPHDPCRPKPLANRAAARQHARIALQADGVAALKLAWPSSVERSPLADVHANPAAALGAVGVGQGRLARRLEIAGRAPNVAQGVDLLCPE